MKKILPLILISLALAGCMFSHRSYQEGNTKYTSTQGSVGVKQEVANVELKVGAQNTRSLKISGVKLDETKSFGKAADVATDLAPIVP